MPTFLFTLANILLHNYDSFSFCSCPLIKTSSYNHFHNILRIFDVLPNVPSTTSKTMGDFYLQTRYIQVAERVAKRLKT